MNAPLRRTRGANVFGDASARADRTVYRILGAQWPSSKWRADPVGFAYFILGVRLWAFQVKLLEAIRDHRHVACAGGRKLGKDFAVAVAALWWYASWPRAKVFLLAPTSTQLDEISFLEIRQLLSESGRCVDCKDLDAEKAERGEEPGPRPCQHSAILTGSVGLKARTGVRSPDFRQIFGKTATSGGRMRGFSGAKVLAIEDEASDIDDEIDGALVGNLASRECHRVALSQPTKTHGWFYRAFHEERDIWHHLQQSSEETPNVLEDRDVFPGLASREWLEDRLAAWGRGSAIWDSDVEGKFPKAAQGQLFTLEAIKAACSPDRLASANTEGRLQLGIDVARSPVGDETSFAPRRGDVVHDLFMKRGMSPEGILGKALDLLALHREPGDVIEENGPIVVLDVDGAEGARALDVFRAYLQRDATTANAFTLVPFRGGAPPLGVMKSRYQMDRDVLYAGLVEWVKRGGCLPLHLKLQGDLLAHRWADRELGKSQLMHKDELRVVLGRSPDAADSVALSTWRIPGLFTPASVDRGQPASDAWSAPAIDPYAAPPSPYG